MPLKHKLFSARIVISHFLFCFLIPTQIFSQNKFKLEIEAPSLINDTLFLIRVGLEELYHFKLDFDFKTRQTNLSGTFFLEPGYYKLKIPKSFDHYNIKINSPINVEYQNFKSLFSDLYIKKSNSKIGFDSLTDLAEKERRIGNYIRARPNSYIALWEIISDYTHYSYNSVYQNNLELFSKKIKAGKVFKTLEERLNAEVSTMIGKDFPNINFNNQGVLTQDYFKSHKLTFIDCWSITCAPCIKSILQIL